MAEVLGVLASASQLVQYAVKISAALSAVHNRVRGAPKLAKYIAQLEELKDASILIQQSPNIQTTQILRYIESAVNDCENLLHLIDRLLRDYTQGSLSRRYYKAARGGKVEAQIEDGFKRLEQTKTSLIFCIGVANTERLSIIQHGVGEIAFGMASATVQQTVRDGWSSKTGPETVSAAETTSPPVLTSRVSNNSHQKCTAAIGASQVNGSLGDYGEENNKHVDCTAQEGSRQLNGSAYGTAGVEVAKGLFGNAGK